MQDEDTTEIDRELIATELERVAKLAGRFKLTDLATEIGWLATKARKPEVGKSGEPG